MAEGLDLGVSGLASGFDWRALVDQLSDVERAPQRRLVQDQQGIQTRKTAYGSIATQLSVLRNRVKDLTDGSLFDARAASLSNFSTSTSFATASAAAGAALGTYAFQVSQLATASVRQGTSNAGAALSSTGDLSAITVSDAAFPIPIKAGTFTVNGKQVTIASTDKLSDVLTAINTATGGDVTASYSSATDKLTLTSASNAEIVLGSTTDTSNFLSAARLSNNGTPSVTSETSLGSVKTAAVLTGANFGTAITGGTTGSFKINGVAIAFDATKDSVTDVLKRINNSTAGVIASYDAVNDRFSLTNKSTGDIGVALEDVSGNFLAATGLSGGSLVRGQDLLYTVNGGGQLRSRTNTITEDSSGITGLSVSVTNDGGFTVAVTNDNAKIKKAITDFIAEYNRAQALIDTNTASTTDAKGKVTAGTLASEPDAFNISSDLRRIIASTSTILGGTLKRLDQIGIEGNGNDNNIAVTDDAALEDMLSDDLQAVENLFLDTSGGIATQLDAYLERIIGVDGTLEKKENTLDLQIADINRQVTDQERIVQANRQLLIDQFVSMERAQQKINQQLQFLQQRFSS
jgi:flagellar hook-associated protein 2